MSLTYGEYLGLDALLDLQRPRSDPPEHDEMLFIIIHQTYELWFKQELHELERLGRVLEAGETYQAVRTLRRMLVILKLAVAQTDILETLTPVDFNRFRDRLEEASGFQSGQFRELEFACGARNPAYLKMFPEGSASRARLERRRREPTLFDRFLDFLSARGHAIPETCRRRDPSEPVGEDESRQAWLRSVYLDDPEAALVVELLVDFDEGFQEWRYRHVKMVERTIGDKPGTGGSSGVEYLRRSLFRPFWPDLWRFRGKL
jgi:tryptophan 2,3-dioxygenase